MGQWDTVLKGRDNLFTDQQKGTQSVVGLWDTLLKEMLLYCADPIRFVGQWTQSIVGLWDTVLKEILLYRADPIRFVGQWDTGLKGRIKRT